MDLVFDIINDFDGFFIFSQINFCFNGFLDVFMVVVGQIVYFVLINMLLVLVNMFSIELIVNLFYIDMLDLFDLIKFVSQDF